MSKGPKKIRNKTGTKKPVIITDDDGAGNGELLCVRGPIYGPSGYARMTRGVIKGLHDAGKNFWVDEFQWAVQPSIEVTEEFRDIMVSHIPTQEEMKKTDGLLIISLPSDIPPSQKFILPNTWLMTIFETTKIPNDWMQVLQSPMSANPNIPAIKGLFLPTVGNLESFDGTPQIKEIVPISMDYDTFTPEGKVADWLPEKSDFNILMSFQNNERKNPKFAFNLINELDENTTVYLKIFRFGMSTWERAKTESFIKSETENALCKIVLLYDMITDESQAEMYRAMDLVINVSRGEGWDLPRCEAYSCGVPAIGPLFIGPEDYTIDEFKLITHSLVPCPEMPPYFTGEAKWAKLDLTNYLQVIHAIRSDKAKYNELALKQRDHLMKHTGSMADMATSIHDSMRG